MKIVVNNEKLLFRRRELRKNQTKAEGIFWSKVRDGRLFGLKFKRQYGIGSYILDFYCREKKLAIEIDGSQHRKKIDYDNERTKYLNSIGIMVLRFWNNDVMKNMDGVLTKIINHLSDN
jgi:very-short-patch-repair endonuclease